MSSLNTAIAFFIFNRPDTTQKAFTEIARSKPQKLFVIADGPRNDKPGEKEKCQKTREIINQVAWKCELFKDYSDVNLGCKKRVSSGLDWVFNEVEEAIILEDDCIAHPTFFQFCENLLKKYRNEPRIAQISGSSWLFNRYQVEESYYFSKVPLCWGWASWRRAWKNYDVRMSQWPSVQESDLLYRAFGDKQMAEFYKIRFDQVYRGAVDTWDYQWLFATVTQNSLAAIPKHNLISNIGFGLDATHTKFPHLLTNIPHQKMSFPLSHPKDIKHSPELDRYVFRKYINISLTKRIVFVLKAMYMLLNR